MQKVLEFLKRTFPFFMMCLLVGPGILYVLDRVFPDPPEMGAFERRGGYHQAVCENYCKGANGVHRNTSVVELRAHFKDGHNAEDFDCVCAPDIIDTD